MSGGGGGDRRRQQRNCIVFLQLRERGLPTFASTHVVPKEPPGWCSSLDQVDEISLKRIEAYTKLCIETSYRFLVDGTEPFTVTQALYVVYIRHHHYIALQNMRLYEFYDDESFKKKEFLELHSLHLNYSSTLLEFAGGRYRFRHPICCHYYVASFFCTRVFWLKNQAMAKLIMSQYTIIGNLVRLMLPKAYSCETYKEAHSILFGINESGE